MKVIKKINNNAALCLDNEGNELVAIGKGIGFPKVPYIIQDLNKIQKTYYGIDARYLELLNILPENYFALSNRIVQKYREAIDNDISSNIVFTLADHLYYAVKRFKQNIQIENLLHYDIQHLYEIEYQVGLEALQLINEEIGVLFPKSEASLIAMHFINAKIENEPSQTIFNFENILTEITDIIGAHFKIYIDKSSVSYSRFVSHMQYLLRRDTKSSSVEYNENFYNSLINEYPDSFECAIKIQSYLENNNIVQLDKNEILYLILHINRLKVREEL